MKEPKLRFPGYIDHLRTVTCGELFHERKEKGQEGLPILSLSIHTGISDHELDDEESTKKVKRSEDKSLYKRVYPHDLAFNMMRAWQGAFGVSKVDGMISPAYIVASPSSEIDADYLDYYIQTDRFIGAANSLSYGVTDFRKRLYWDSFCKIKIHLPSLSEQRKVADLLSMIDTVIEKQKATVEAWEDRKKGVMQKLFSQEVRFKADDGSEFPDWEKKKLCNVLSYEQPTKYIVESTEYNDKYDIPVLTAGQSLVLGYTNEKNGVYIASPTNPVIIFDDFTTSFHWIDFPFKVKSSAMKFLTLNDNDCNFLFVYNAMQVIDYTPMSHSRQWISTYSMFEIPYPCLAEQQKIADCLSSLVDVIEKQKATLAAWEEMKKGLLQQMFV